MPEPRDTARRLHRALRRRRRLISALFAAAAVFALARVVSPAPQDTTDVVVAAHDLPGGDVIDPDDVRVVQMPMELAPLGTVNETADLLREVLAAPVRAGEPISDRRLVGEALISGYADGLVAAPVRISDADVASLLQVGDHIDVYAAQGDESASARLVVSNAVVVTLPQVDGDDHDGALVVLGVTSPSAAAVAQASSRGPLAISLRR
jgi:Flp pilus assembly protein CpaB